MFDEQFKQLHRFYRKHLLQDVLPFWTSRIKDQEAGGYWHCFDRKGALTDTAKYMWCQGRQVWMFSALFHQFEKNPQWLDLARHGRDFIVEHGYAGAGRWYYQMDRSGRVTKANPSFYSDCFAVLGLGEYALASGDDQDRALIEETFNQIQTNLKDDKFSEFYHFHLDPKYIWHGPHMITLNVAANLRPFLGDEKTHDIIDYCLEKILYVFAKDDMKVLFECLTHDGRFIEDNQVRLINPGHTMESMWFCLEEGRCRNDRQVIDRAVEVIDWAYNMGHDDLHGGLFALVDYAGGPPKLSDDYKRFGMTWDVKSWWVQSETLYALLLAAVESKNQRYFERFMRLHEYCQKYFFDSEYGEWYCQLERNGIPRMMDKGTWVKSAFHLPRNLMSIVRLLNQGGN